MDVLTQPEEVFTKTVDTLEAYSKAQEAALRNTGQSKWLAFSEKANTKTEMLADLDRTALNKKYIELLDNAKERHVYELIAIVAQNDFVGAIARDFYDVKRSRLTRIFHQTAVHNGKTGGEGTLKSVVTEWINLKFKQPKPEGSTT